MRSRIIHTRNSADVLPFSTDKILPVHRLVAGELLPVQLPGAILSILEKAEFHVGRLFKAYQQLGAGMPLHLKHGETFRPHGLAGNHLRRRYGVMPDHQRKRLQGIPHEGGFLDHVRSAQIFLRLHQGNCAAGPAAPSGECGREARNCSPPCPSAWPAIPRTASPAWRKSARRPLNPGMPGASGARKKGRRKTAPAPS